MNLGDISDLCRLRLDRDLKALKDVCIEENNLKEEMNSIRLSLQKYSRQTHSLAYSLAGEQEWMAWANARITVLNSRLSNTLARKAYIREIASNSFGRKEAIRFIEKDDVSRNLSKCEKVDLERFFDLRSQISFVGRAL